MNLVHSSSTTTTTTTLHPSPEDCLTILEILGFEMQSSSSSHPNSMHQKRRVRFSMQPSIQVPTNRSDRDQQSFWYQQREIVAFKKQARKNFKSHGGTLQRQLHRHKSIQCTLSAYKKGMSIENIAKVARACAKWSREIAFMQACHDYADAYQPQLTKTIPKLSNIPPEFPFALKRAKSSRTNFPTKRRVRRRVL
jgi:hypothetical protein